MRLWRKAKTKTTIPDVFELRAKAARFNPLRNLTPERLSQQLDDFRAGRYASVAQTLAMIEERDPILKPCAAKRKKEVARYGWEVLTVEDKGTEAEAERHKEVLEYFYNNLTATNVVDLDETGGMRLLTRQMMDAIGVKYAVHEVVWKPQPDGQISAELRYVPLWFFEHEGSRLGFLREYGQITGEPLEPGEWMVTVGDTLMVSSAICYMFKHLPMQDWLAYCEKFGIPGVKGKTAAAQGSAEWDAMEEAVASFANEFAAVMSLTDDIETIERKGGGDLPFPGLVETCDRYIATLWRGADLGTISKGQGLGASLQGEESDLLLDDDIELISETLQTKLSRFVIEYTFGAGVEPLAYIQLRKPQKDNTDKDLKVDQTLHSMGFPISKQDLSERYQRPLPDKDEDALGAEEEEGRGEKEEEEEHGQTRTDTDGHGPEEEEALATEGTENTEKKKEEAAAANEAENNRMLRRYTLEDRIEAALAGEVTNEAALRALLSEIEEAAIAKLEPVAKALEEMLAEQILRGAAEAPQMPEKRSGEKDAQ